MPHAPTHQRPGQGHVHGEHRPLKVQNDAGDYSSKSQQELWVETVETVEKQDGDEDGSWRPDGVRSCVRLKLHSDTGASLNLNDSVIVISCYICRW